MTDERIRRRIFLLGVLPVLLMIFLAVKLFNKQVSFSDYNRKIMHQSVRKIRIPARRGRIYSSDLKIVADNRMVFDVLLYIQEIRRSSLAETIDAVIDNISEISLLLGRTSNISRRDVQRHLNWYPGLPLKVFSDLDERERIIINDHLADRPGWALEVDAVRIYPCSDWGVHFLGYTRKGNPAAASDRKDFSYYIADYEGRGGLEKAFDTLQMPDMESLRGLRGRPGYSLVQVDNLGYVHHSMVEEIPPLHGNHLQLNIDFNAQKKAHEMIQDLNGALVLVDADNGDIIVMASSPGYDLAKFSPYIENEYYKSLLADETRPLVPKAYSGTFTPGSIIKPLIALAALENGTSSDELIKCDGYTQVGDAKINCTAYWYGGHGELDMVTAIEKSCNDYFIENGRKLGRKVIFDYMKSAGFGSAPKMEISGAAGVLPTEENKYKRFKTRWNEFDTSLISIGQGIITISPLQAALYTAALANGGKVYRPHLVKAVLDQQGNVLYERRVNTDSIIKGSAENFEIVRQGMFNVVNSPSGSGRKAKLDGYTLYGKTGTAELTSGRNRRQNTWFIAYTRHKGRTYAAALIVQDGQSGGSTCAPLMAEFFKYFLENKKD